MSIENETTGTRDSRDTAKDAVKGLAEEGKQAARSASDRVAEEVSRKADDTKSGVADEISDVGHALRTAANELREGSPQERSFGKMASTLADLSDTVRDKDVSEMVDDISDYARKNPLGFLAGAALLGFAGTRLAKASRRSSGEPVDLRALWDTDEHDDELGRHITGGTRPVAPRSQGVTSELSAPAIARNNSTHGGETS